MQVLNEVTKETINLSWRQSSKVKIIEGYDFKYQIGVNSKPGTLMSLGQSLTGIVYMAVLSDSEFEAIMSYLEMAVPCQFKSINMDLINSVTAEVKTNGMTMRCDVAMEGVGALCLPVISPLSHDPVVVGIVGPSERLRKNAKQHYETVKRLVCENEIRPVYNIK